MGKSCKRVIGLHRKPAPILTRSKKDRPDDPFSVKFFRRPAGRPDKKLSVHSPKHILVTIKQTVETLLIEIVYCSTDMSSVYTKSNKVQ